MTLRSLPYFSFRISGEETVPKKTLSNYRLKSGEPAQGAEHLHGAGAIDDALQDKEKKLKSNFVVFYFSNLQIL